MESKRDLEISEDAECPAPRENRGFANTPPYAAQQQQTAPHAEGTFAVRRFLVRLEAGSLRRVALDHGEEIRSVTPQLGVADAVHRCRRAGIDVKIVTGDDLETARAVASEIGLLDRPDALLLTGRDFNALADVLGGKGGVGAERRPIGSGQLAVFGGGDTVSIAADANGP